MTALVTRAWSQGYRLSYLCPLSPWYCTRHIVEIQMFGGWKLSFAVFQINEKCLVFLTCGQKKSYSDEGFSISTSHSGFMEIWGHIWLRFIWFLQKIMYWTTTLSHPVLGTGDTRKVRQSLPTRSLQSSVRT